MELHINYFKRKDPCHKRPFLTNALKESDFLEPVTNQNVSTNTISRQILFFSPNVNFRQMFGQCVSHTDSCQNYCT